jgi:hypothetical protein
MQTFKKILLGLIGLAAITCFFVWLFIFYLPTRKKDLTKETASLTVSSTQLVQDFQEDETAANKKYNDKIIDINGRIAEIQQDSLLNITLLSADIMSAVYCTSSIQNTINLHAGDSITIRGICTGYLSDVKIKEAVIIKKH